MIIKAAITPGTQPQRVKIKTINTEPHPKPITAIGGKIIDNKTWVKFIEKNSILQIYKLSFVTYFLYLLKF